MISETNPVVWMLEMTFCFSHNRKGVKSLVNLNMQHLRMTFNFKGLIILKFFCKIVVFCPDNLFRVNLNLRGQGRLQGL